MERLTEHHVNKTLGAYMVCSGACIDDNFDCNGCEKIGEIVDRLAAYEDTGLEPDEIVGLCSMSERAKMADLLRLEEYQDIGAVNHLRELAQAEKDGRLVVLPCKAGDTVWAESPIKGMVYSFEAPDIAWIIESADQFGKTVFLTREEAEAALKMREDA